MNRKPLNLVDDGGAPIALGLLLGQGGEGAVWDIPSKPDLVAKVYHEPLLPERAMKIRAMAGMDGAGLKTLTAWPVGLLEQHDVGPVGLLLPKVSGAKDIHELYSPKSRRVEFQQADWRFLIRAAGNTSRAFAAVHQAGCVIGDVNHGGILVAPNATVRLIDCDSFQVAANGRQYLCEVGVDNFTPPELQSRSFKGIVRTENHDNFGLAVVIFLLTFMGRHPFAGRYSGQGDMAISKAIEEIRFPYGAHRSQALMTPPPGMPSLSIVGPEIAALFERAFARSSIGTGRPTAKEWIAGLEHLEKNQTRCTANRVHWHHKATNCPWCAMEGTTGVPLFSLALESSTSLGTFSMTAFWAMVDSLQQPGPVPIIAANPKMPSAQARKVRHRNRLGYLGAAVVGVMCLVGAILTGNPEVLFSAVGVVIIVTLMRGGKGVEDIDQRYKATKAQWQAANTDWERKAGNGAFNDKKAAIANLRQQWEGLPSRKANLLEVLKKNQPRLQLERYLDTFKISAAKIESIGSGRTQTLESYGVETALDATRANLQNVPGFGPKTQQKLIAWRTSIEACFRFDPTKGVDPRDIQKIDTDIRAAARDLEDRLNRSLAELRQVKAQIMGAREHLRAHVERVHDELMQADADYKAIH
ncbi:hypothetical protein [Burkholderia sp. L27(2015)]|uniref:hypothetical protein n=1 Tax=Burkholderia sp. L27(2015) TaxID=1641858 RepID=UPI00131D4B57|nr:hypothetical protein [Burkholderia sp. L27(2015)]